jgi:predicted RNA-binding protein associated with RNAse of E/G family
MKRTYADRPNWSRVIEKRFNLDYIDDGDFKGFLSIICIDKVREPLVLSVSNNRLCLIDDGYIWTQHFPIESKYALTTMFNKEQEVVQWYFDICNGNKINDIGIPYYDDLYLDVVVLPSGEIIMPDEDELNDAFKNNEISIEEYNLAYYEAEKLINSIKSGKTNLLKNTKAYLNHMLSLIND